MFLGDKNKQSDLLIPWCTYTEPEVAHVGKYEEELTRAGVEFESYMVGDGFVLSGFLLFFFSRFPRSRLHYVSECWYQAYLLLLYSVVVLIKGWGGGRL